MQSNSFIPAADGGPLKFCKAWGTQATAPIFKIKLGKPHQQTALSHALQ